MRVILIGVMLVISIVPIAQADRHRHQRPVTAHHTKAPHRLSQLPAGHHVIRHAAKPYYFSGGRWYDRIGGTYVSISAPIGARVATLPVGYLTIGIGINRRFYLSGTYYRQVETGYEVIAKPPEAGQASSSSDSKRLIVYPAAGQSPAQSKRDKYECHEWATHDTGYDPTIPDADPAFRSDYNRGIGACLEARNYVVR